MKRDNVTAIGKRVKEIRRYFRLSQKEMADNLKMSYSYLSEIECGKANPGPEFFLKLSNDYNISMDYLFHGIGNMFLGSHRKIEEEEYDLDEDIYSIEKLVWLMDHSPFYKNTILSFASKFLLDNERIIKKSIEKNKMRKEKKNE
jgi:transcriptional regulator with XRE-family HTH domain